MCSQLNKGQVYSLGYLKRVWDNFLVVLGVVK